MTLAELLAKATPGPWRLRRPGLDPDQPNAPPSCYGIAAGEETWHRNMGHFHPADATYPRDEILVVEIGYDRDYHTPEAAIPRIEDASLIALAPDLAQLALDMGEALRAAHDPERWSDFLTMQVDELLARLDGIADKGKTT